MKHHLKILVSKKPPNSGIVSCKTITVRERILRHLLGVPQKLTLIVPGDTVEEVCIKELKEGVKT